MILTCINYYTYRIYHYNTIDAPTFLCNTSHTIFACFDVYINLESLFGEPTVEILGAENMPFQSRNLILNVIVSVRLCNATKTEDDPLSIQYDVLCNYLLIWYFRK